MVWQTREKIIDAFFELAQNNPEKTSLLFQKLPNKLAYLVKQSIKNILKIFKKLLIIFTKF